MTCLRPFIDDLLIAFSGNPLDRAEDRRGDADWLASAKRHGRFLPVHDGRVAMVVGAELDLGWQTFDAAEPALEDRADCVLLGLDAAGRACFAYSAAAPEEGEGIKYIDARSIALQLAGPERDGGRTGIVAQALALIGWHARHRFCARCGAKTEARRGGYQRFCTACETEHFPRTDPVAIMLAVNGERCLLGRQPQFPPGVFSALAGFVEAGESLEAAVRRELHEEAGIHAGRLAYVGSQPWPFPSSLMLGFIAEAKSEEIVVDATELEEARWFSADEVRAALDGQGGGLFLPPAIAMAHQLIRIWLDDL